MNLFDIFHQLDGFRPVIVIKFKSYSLLSAFYHCSEMKYFCETVGSQCRGEKKENCRECIRRRQKHAITWLSAVVQSK